MKESVVHRCQQCINSPPHLLHFSEMYQREKSKSLAVKTFQENRSRYHTIAASMVAKDLKLS